MSPRQPDEDAKLMLAFQAGDRGAFERLFARYTSPLIGFLSRMVPDRGRAEELAQEVFVRVYGAKDRYEPRAKFSTWIFGIAHNLALNELDRAYRKREEPLEPAHESIRDTPDATVDEELDAKRTATRIASALERLPARQRAAVTLRSEQGLGYEEIASVMETSIPSVKSLLHRARERLLVELEETRS
jgi:RNA polymerase sigma-70 factor (ECF subfamily)